MKNKSSALTIAVAVLAVISLLLVSCGSDPATEESKPAASSAVSASESNAPSSAAEPSSEEQESSLVIEPEDPYFSSYDNKTSFDNSDTAIVFGASSVTVNGTGASANGTVVTITEKGTYVISGTCPNGQIIVSLDKTLKARLVLNDLNLTCVASAPIWVKSADKVAITLAEGSVNTLTDTATYTFDNADEEPNACVFSKDDLTINGSGTLTVNANCNNGIGTKDDLHIVSGTLNINAKNNALKGNDSIAIKDGNITVVSTDDGIKTSNEVDEGKGFIYIRNGNITVNAGDDAIQATQAVIVEGGNIISFASGKSVNCNGTVNVAEGSITER